MVIIALFEIEWYIFPYQYLFFCGTSCIHFICIDINFFFVISEFVLVSRILRKIWIGQLGYRRQMI